MFYHTHHVVVNVCYTHNIAAKVACVECVRN